MSQTESQQEFIIGNHTRLYIDNDKANEIIEKLNSILENSITMNYKQWREFISSNLPTDKLFVGYFELNKDEMIQALSDLIVEIVESLVLKSSILSEDVYNLIVNDVIISGYVYVMELNMDDESNAFQIFRDYFRTQTLEEIKRLEAENESLMDEVPDSYLDEIINEELEAEKQLKQAFENYEQINSLKEKYVSSLVRSRGHKIKTDLNKENDTVEDLKIDVPEGYTEKVLSKEERLKIYVNNYKVSTTDEVDDDKLYGIFNVEPENFVLNFEKLNKRQRLKSIRLMADYWNNKVADIPVTERYVITFRVGDQNISYGLHQAAVREQIEDLFLGSRIVNMSRAANKLRDEEIYEYEEVPDIKIIDEIKLEKNDNLEEIRLRKIEKNKAKRQAKQAQKQLFKDRATEKRKLLTNLDIPLEDIGFTLSDEDIKLREDYRKILEDIKRKEEEFAKTSKRTRINKDRGGAFLPYLIESVVTDELKTILKRYQIFDTLCYDNEKKKLRIELTDNCFIYALCQAGIRQNLLNQIRARINDRYIGKKAIKTLCDEIGINVEIYMEDANDGKVRKQKIIHKGASDTKHGDKNGITIKLGCYKNHYFLYEDVSVTRYYIEHYDDINKYIKIHKKPIEWGMKVCKMTNTGLYRIDNKYSTMSSYNLIKILIANKFLRPMTWRDQGVLETDLYKYVSDNTSDLKGMNLKYSTKLMKPKLDAEGCEDEKQNLTNPEEYDDSVKIDSKRKTTSKRKFNDKDPIDILKENTVVYYADIESHTVDDNHLPLPTHVPYLISVSRRDTNVILPFYGHNCIEKMLDFMEDKATIYFHNLGYDGRLIAKYGISQRGTIMKGTKIYKLALDYKGKKLFLKDSLALINAPLSRFPTMFYLPEIEKEIFPYNYYTESVVNNPKKACISKAHLYENKPWDEKTKQQFIINIDKIGCRTGPDSFDAEKYAIFYCNRDVELLRNGFEKFRNGCLDDFNMDVDKYLTASSLADAYFRENIYNANGNMFEYSGLLRETIKKAVYGGRCMCAENKSYHVTKTLTDYDAVSLYPSAMNRLWLVEGIPKVFEEDLYDPEYLISSTFLDDQLEPSETRFISAYIVNIQITSVGKHRAFPLIVRRENGLNINCNECIKMTVDNIMLEDLIVYQDIEFEILGGIYWSGNRDHRIRSEIRKIFDKRNELKKAKNPLQEVYKLLMNSAYGKCIQAAIKQDTIYRDEEGKNKYYMKNYFKVNKAYQIDGGKWALEVNKQIDSFFNNTLFGVQVLSMSKRIMNEVMCLAEDLNLNIYYQDTDSMHIELDHLEILEREFESKFGRNLRGSDMGQFHPDFEPVVKGGKVPVSIESFFIGKKTYIDKLVDEEGNIGYHIRMKGIPLDTIKNMLAENNVSNPLELYEYLFNDNSFEFDLCDKRVQFKMGKDMTIHNLDSFCRRIERPQNYEKVEV